MCICPAVDQARQLSEGLGIPLSCVMPVKNYSAELDLHQDTDVLLFTAVEQMLNYADSFFENQDDADANNDQELYRLNCHLPPASVYHWQTAVVYQNSCIWTN